MDEGDTREKTALALSFENVVERLENPEKAFSDLEKWIEYVGIVSDRPQHEVNSFYAEREIHMDFFSGPREGKLGGLERAKERERFDAVRYIFVGASKRDEVIAEKAGWEYKDIENLAEESGWRLNED